MRWLWTGVFFKLFSMFSPRFQYSIRFLYAFMDCIHGELHRPCLADEKQIQCDEIQYGFMDCCRSVVHIDFSDGGPSFFLLSHSRFRGRVGHILLYCELSAVLCADSEKLPAMYRREKIRWSRNMTAPPAEPFEW